MLFLTAFDPQGKSSGSIDPLGALQSYTSLADLLLPGVTTITTRARYLSMLCASLANAERHIAVPPGPAGSVTRRQAALGFERLWAVACVAAEKEGKVGAAVGLRGVSYARAEWERFCTRGTAGADFNMLQSQERTGGVGTYWSALAGAGLTDRDAGALTSEGRALAALFPMPPLDDIGLGRLAVPATSQRVRLPLKETQTWGADSHLGAAKANEQRLLRACLTADPRRAAVARALASLPDRPDVWDSHALRSLRGRLALDQEALSLGLPTALDAVLRAEAFHEAALAVFGRGLWWGTEQSGKPLADLIALAETRASLEAMRARAGALHAFALSCERAEVRLALASFVPFAAEVMSSPGDAGAFHCVLGRHRRVQSGKLDGGVPKRDWVTLGQGGLLRPAPRFQRSEPPPVPTGLALTHPYRLEPFAGMLAETGFFKAATP
jgi:hypothetical protein